MAQHPNQLNELFDDLKKCHGQEIDLSLTRMLRLLTHLNHPENRLPPILHVAGTNGKGSTIAFMEAMLRAGGYGVHSYTSPHLIRFHERIRLNGQMIDDDLFCHYLREVITINGNQPLTFFEGTTAAAFLSFVSHPTDLLLLETGLGGRLDATNVIPYPLLSIITPISLDHQDFLGTTLSTIAFEKAGIIKPHCPVVIARQPPEVYDILISQAQKCQAPVIRLEDFPGIIEAIKTYDLSLQGPYQQENAALAWLALEVLKEKFPISNTDKIQGLASANWPGRWQQITSGSLVDYIPPESQLWIDGAHNEAGLKSLLPALEHWKEEGYPIVVGTNMLANRPCQDLLEPLKAYVDDWFYIAVTSEHQFHCPDAFNIPFRSCIHVDHLAKNLQDWSNGSRILITGSLYLVGNVLELNQKHPSLDLENKS
jgi:dihydrofolate synthase/folylpolyglutamate synthase